MFSHITVGCDDLRAAGEFYDAVLGELGLSRRAVKPDGGPPALCWEDSSRVLPRFYVYQPYDGLPATSGNGSMTAFLAQSRAAVDAAYSAGLSAGGLDDGRPGARIHYGPDYYGAYLRDPGGNKIHVVHRGDLDHSLGRDR